jgi:hypothetical protein
MSVGQIDPAGKSRSRSFGQADRSRLHQTPSNDRFFGYEQRLMGNDKIALTQLIPRPARMAFRPEFGLSKQFIRSCYELESPVWTSRR